MNKVHFSSASAEWSTPQALFDELNKEFNFSLDVCATAENTKCAEHYTAADDGLSRDWTSDVCWMNPPYGRAIGAWVEKAALAGKGGGRVVALLPARPDTRWWHKWIWDAEKHAPREGVQVRFIPGRLKFGDSKNSAPFPSVLVVFG